MRTYTRQAAAAVRTLVVASSTLAILVICFAMYEFSQPAPVVTTPAPKPRLPSVPTGPSDAATDTDYTRTPDPETVPSLAVGDQAIGPSERIRMSLYGSEGSRSRAEIYLKAWTPVDGSPNELFVVKPEVRLRTNNGHAILATAREGHLEIEGKIGGNLDVKRGRLSGNVVIEIDRLTEDERAALPVELRDRIDPSQIVRIEADEIEFDREYAKLIIDGPVRLMARDADVWTSNVEIRFNETAGRVEYCRINAGGRTC
ncbi:MAG: hypothetical protein IID43_02400 [Planctomycetes bacterium]|nr:hypothetical protein [Planctomycetota bacterium]